MAQFLREAPTWAWSILTIGVAVAAALIIHHLLFAAAQRLVRRTGSVFDNSLVRHGRRPLKVILPVVATLFVLPLIHLPSAYLGPVRHAEGLVLIALVAWLLIALVEVAQDVIAARYNIQAKDNLAARRIRTQVQVLRRVVVIVIAVLALSVMLMTFPAIWNVGAGLFASAGVAGLVAALAARPTLSSLLAGIQIALTQPIRIDDVVIVEGEWGWIEEIGATYVVVRIWDLRRLVLPLSYFIEKPFQNWTRVTADLLGTVFVYTDYTVPVEPVRQELKRILDGSGMWDGKVWGLQVTNASEHTMELRALMSAPDSGRSWDLRCYVREKLIEYLQRNYPESLPRTRAEIRGLAA